MLVDAIVEAIRLAVTRIPDDVVSALRKAYGFEESEIARFNLENILKAVEIGKDGSIPVCPDTGTLTFFVQRRPRDFPVSFARPPPHPACK